MDKRISPVPYRDDFAVLLATGAIDAMVLRKALNETAQRLVVIDLTRVESLTEDCLPVLAAAARRARAEGRGFAVAANALPVLRSVWATKAPIPAYLSLSDAMRDVAEQASAAPTVRVA